MSRRALQAVLRTIGAVAIAAGSDSLMRGDRAVLHGDRVSANVDSELRFFAAWYVVFGALVLRAARRPESETAIVRACVAGFFLAAIGRVLSMRSSGKPDPLFRALMCVEFSMLALVPWQHRVAQASAST